MPQKHTGKDTYTFFIYLIYKSYTVRLFLRKYFPKPGEYVCKALEKSKKIVQIICFFNLQLCTLYNSFVLSVQCYRVKCRMCTNTLANFVQSYYYTQRKKQGRRCLNAFCALPFLCRFRLFSLCIIVVLSFIVVLLLSFSLRGKASSVRFRDFLDSSFLRFRDILDSIPY